MKFSVADASVDLFHMLCLPKQSVHHLLPPLHKCNNGHSYEITHLWSPKSPDLNPTDYKISGIIQHQVYQTKAQDMSDLMQCLTDAWAGVENGVLLTMPLTSGAVVSTPTFELQQDIW